MAKLPERKTTLSRIWQSWEETQKNPEKPWNEKGWRAHLGGSIIGRECSRQLWFNFRWAYPVTFKGRILRLFDTGHREEPRLIADLENAGCTVYAYDPATGEQFRCSNHGGHFGGSKDALILGVAEAEETWHLGEFKTSNEKYFKETERDGVRKAKPEHFTQMNVYMGEWNRELAEAKRRLDEGSEALELTDLIRIKIGRLERAFYMMQNKNTDAIYTERIAFDPNVYRQALDRAKMIIEADEPPEGISEDPTFYKCKYMCDFKHVCHQIGDGGALPSAHCRTCAHSTPNTEAEGGRWDCSKDGWPEPIGGPQAQFEGCEDHVFHPSFIPFEVAGYDEEHTPPRWISYHLPGGRRLMNATEDGMVDFRQHVARLHFEEGLTPDEAKRQVATQMVGATSFELAESPIDRVLAQGGE